MAENGLGETGARAIAWQRANDELFKKYISPSSWGVQKVDSASVAQSITVFVTWIVIVMSRRLGDLGETDKKGENCPTTHRLHSSLSFLFCSIFPSLPFFLHLHLLSSLFSLLSSLFSLLLSSLFSLLLSTLHKPWVAPVQKTSTEVSVHVQLTNSLSTNSTNSNRNTNNNNNNHNTNSSNNHLTDYRNKSFQTPLFPLAGNVFLLYYISLTHAHTDSPH